MGRRTVKRTRKSKHIHSKRNVSKKGSSKKTLHKGDVVKCPPNTPHWHGASEDKEFIQIAITSRVDGPTEWLSPVTKDEYNH